MLVDQFSGLSFVHLQKTCTSKETLDAKMAFEGYTCSLNVKIQHYHADKERFCENLWMNNVKKDGHTISFCSVNRHFQNGVTEQQIQDLSDGTQTLLLHAKERWGNAISVHLLPYAVRHRNDVYNAMRKVSKQVLPIEIVSNMTTQSCLKHFHAFSCPAYRLNRGLQGRHSQPKWEQQAELVVYLGGSPKHTSSITLVLDLTTAHVSPQFHLKFDTFSRQSLSRGRMPKRKNHCGSSCVISGGRRRRKPNHPLLHWSTKCKRDKCISQVNQRSCWQGSFHLMCQVNYFLSMKLMMTKLQTAPLKEEIHLFRHHQKQLRKVLARYQEEFEQFVKSQEQLAKGLYFTSHESIDPQMYMEDLLLKDSTTDPISFKATAKSTPCIFP
jgi:hypothetical protein